MKTERLLFVLWLVLVSTGVAVGQSVQRARCWIDRGPQPATTVSSFASVDVSLSGLLPGLHIVSAMVQDSEGRWSSPVSHYFVLLSPADATGRTLVQCQYWVDRDFAGARTGSMANGVASVDLDVSSLLPGMHSLTIRAKDNAGRWSTAVSNYFVLVPIGDAASRSFVQCQYWIDRDFAGARMGSMANGVASVDLDVSSLRPGLHSVSVRAQNNAGRWSSVVSHYFVLVSLEAAAANTMTACRYWIDGNNDNPITVELTDGVLNVDEDIAALRPGTHSVTCMLQDNSGRWTAPITHFFAVVDSNALRDALLVGYEYWFNSAPRIHVDVTPSKVFDMDNILVPINDVIPNKIESYRFDVSSLTAFVPDNVLFGFHVIDDAGNLSAACTDTIAMEVPVPITFTLLKHRQPETDSVPAKCAFNGYRCENLREGSVVTLTVTGDAKMTIDIYGNDGNRLECQPVTEYGVTVWRVSPPAGNLYFVAYDAKGEAAEVEVEVSIDVHGDVNMDGEVGVADVTSLVAILLYGTDNEEMRLRADVNLDGEVGVADLTALVAIVMGTK